MDIDHIGYAVRDIERARRRMEALGYVFQEVEEDPDRNVRIQFGEKDGYRIELVSPLKERMEAPVDAYLQAVGNTPYHICYRSPDLEGDIGRLKGQRYKVILPPREAVALGGRKVAFLANRDIGMIEIVEEP